MEVLVSIRTVMVLLHSGLHGVSDTWPQALKLSVDYGRTEYI